MNEKWMDMYVEGYCSKYIISNFGTIKYKDTKETVKTHLSDKGYVRIYLRKDRLPEEVPYKTYLVHRLVLENFAGGHRPDMTGDHINKNKLNNRIDNLQWLSREDNSKESHLFGRIYPAGVDSNNIKYTEDQIREACQLLEYNELTIREISDITMVNQDTINKIKSKKQWSSISKEYNIPDTVPNKNISVYTNEFKTKIKQVLLKYPNYSNKEIIIELGLGYNGKLCMVIHRVRKSLNK